MMIVDSKFPDWFLPPPEYYGASLLWKEIMRGGHGDNLKISMWLACCEEALNYATEKR